jgi:hypothetical protein
VLLGLLFLTLTQAAKEALPDAGGLPVSTPAEAPLLARSLQVRRRQRTRCYRTRSPLK